MPEFASDISKVRADLGYVKISNRERGEVGREDNCTRCDRGIGRQLYGGLRDEIGRPCMMCDKVRLEDN